MRTLRTVLSHNPTFAARQFRFTICYITLTGGIVLQLVLNFRFRRSLMRMTGRLFLCCMAVIATVLITSPLIKAAHPDASLDNRIKNFGRINQNYYRGARPRTGDYAYLRSLGIKSIIDLERGGEAAEKQMVENAGMRFYHIPLSDTGEPSREQTEQFLKIVNDPKNEPIYIHCHAGRHRAGAMTAIYRIEHDGWTADRAYAEMKQYQFKRGVGHSALKKCVYDYSSSVVREKK